MKEFQVIIIGSGPGGYVAAILAGILGLKTALLEKDPFLGGTCLHRGCIPTKALLHTAHLYDEFKGAAEYGLTAGELGVDFPKVHKRKTIIVRKLSKGIEYLMKKRKIDVFTGTGSLVDGHTVSVKGAEGEETIRGESIIIATGSAPSQLPNIVPDHKTILDSDDILQLETIPKSLAVIGAGAVGVEFASIFNSFGSDVSVVELLPRIVPLEDEEISNTLEKSFNKKGIKTFTASQVTAIDVAGDGAVLTIDSDGQTADHNVDKVLLSVGRKPLTSGIGLEQAGIKLDDGGYIEINEFMQTALPNVYAIGDIVRTPWLAHVASAEGILAVNHIAGKHTEPIDYTKTPNCTYCSPEVASVGLSEKAAADAGYDVKTGRFPFSAIGKAMIVGETEGFVKIVSDGSYDEVLGVHIIGPKATELLAEASLGLRLETTVEEIAKTVHAHPTLSEAMLEAAHSVYDEAIHI
ncbi:MAG: dihydrolipoyl dehydrogenase [Candidatus Latescibacterota bacterium]|nr:MAG: dihydrolipoyl dehydrogenase [Candidatus Latescibacterota bacterium]